MTNVLAIDTWRRVSRLAWPATVTGIFRVSMRTVDLVVVGRVVGASGIAAIGIADALVRAPLRLASGLAAGTVALVSQRSGAGDRAGADQAMTHALILASGLGFLVAVSVWLGAQPLFQLLGAEPDVAVPGSSYLRIVVASAPFRMATIMAEKGVMAAADTRTPMFIRSSATAVNIALTVLLVPGLLGAPELGLVGAAFGTAAGNVLAAMGFLAVLSSRRGPVSISRPAWDWATTSAIVRIGTPQVGERLVDAVADIPLNAILLAFGTDANAAFQVGRRIQQYARTPARGFAAASSALVGSELGGGRPSNARRYAYGSLSLSAVVAILIAGAVAATAPWLALVFVERGAAHDLTVSWTRVLAGALVFRSSYIVLRGAYQAAGKTRVPLNATVIGVGTGRLGLSWVVGVVLTGSLWGVYLGVGLDFVLRTLFLGWPFRRGSSRRTGPLEAGPLAGSRASS